ncbi:hypothetical protein B0182_01785 [Moraxella bovis]|nr:hypothetical protein B0182_01785 [Moraxella bovis]
MRPHLGGTTTDELSLLFKVATSKLVGFSIMPFKMSLAPRQSCIRSWRALTSVDVAEPAPAGALSPQAVRTRAVRVMRVKDFTDCIFTNFTGLPIKVAWVFDKKELAKTNSFLLFMSLYKLLI